MAGRFTALLSGPLLAIFVLSEYLMITFRRGEFLFPKLIWWRIGGDGLAAMIVSPVVFLVLHWLALSFGFLPAARATAGRARLAMPQGASSMRRPLWRGPRIELRIYALGFLVLVALAGLVLQLWWVQVARGSLYAAKIVQRSEITVRIPSVRGEIRDRNGIPLVQNRASYEVDFYLPEMVQGFRERNDGQVPYIQYQAPVHGMLQNMREEDVVQIVNSSVIPRLETLDLARDYNARQLKTHYRNDTPHPVHLSSGHRFHHARQVLRA